MDGDWRTKLIVPTGCLRAPLLSNTEKIKWRKVYVSMPIIRNNRTVKGLSIPIVRNNRIVKRLSISIFRIKIFGERCIDTYRTNPSVPSLSANILSPEQYRPENVYRYLLVVSICSDK